MALTLRRRRRIEIRSKRRGAARNFPGPSPAFSPEDAAGVIIEITRQQKKTPLLPSRIKKIVQKILKKEGVRTARLSLVFVTDRVLRDLNKKFLQHDYPTDVLAFDFRERKSFRGKSSRKQVRCLEGEIVVSTGAACRQARAFHSTPRREIILYIAHGILHLLGYDDQRPRDREKMRKKEREILDYLELGK